MSNYEWQRTIIAARNIAKFIAASDGYALGKKVNADDYIAAADEAAHKEAERFKAQQEALVNGAGGVPVSS